MAARSKAATPQPHQAASRTGPAAAITAGPTPVADDAATITALGFLLNVEAQTRACTSVGDLQLLIANETSKLGRARQIVVATINTADQVTIVAVSAVSTVDRSSLLVVALEQMLARMGREGKLSQSLEFALPAYCEPGSELVTSYPFREMAWVPFLDRNKSPFAGILLSRESIWTTDDLSIVHRLGATYAHAWLALAPRRKPLWSKRKGWRWAVAVAAVLALMIPIPITALAPVEIMPFEPAVVAAPIDGVIDVVEIDPGTAVRAGSVLARYSDTTLRNRRDVAMREVAVAQARVKQQTLMAFSDARGRQELGTAEAELELKRAELVFAEDLLARSVIRAPRDGIAIFPDRRSLTGRPVATGERLIEIADPARVEARIDLAMPDSIALKIGGRAKLFLDVDPLHPWTGRISRSDFRARPSDADVMTIRTFVNIENDGGPPPRIGLRGTAQIYGDPAPIIIAVFRRPLSAARQWLGL